ncbi:hypothetical protein TrVFT333_011702 [Trichoderma virens FT-333]|nr:hypothetical protein TrVFT333_011702 [Trichoderma virens FT-333]
MANIDALPTVSASKQPDSTIEMQQLSDAFCSVLNIAEEAQSGSSSSNLTDLTDHSDENVARNKAQWKDFFTFMGEKAKNSEYPKYLFRAHNHGHPFPRFLDDGTGQYSDSFGSDLHLWVEYDAQSPICVPIGDLTEFYTVEDFFSELRFHLEKTQINGQEERAGEKPTLSSIVSLSGDFQWTAQRICSVGRRATKDQRPGLAVFETSLIDPSMVRVWRVMDMLLFLDTTMLLKRSVNIPLNLRRWAGNADEYVCWSFVPREALITFIPLPKLTEAPNYGGKAF